MFGSIRNIFGTIKVTQSDKMITVDGVPADVIDRDISKIWNTSKISSYMFVKISKYSFSFPLFFAPDILYTLDTLIKHRKTNSDIRTLNKIKEKLLESTWLFDTLDENKQRLNLDRLSDLTYTPLPFQMDFLNYYSKTLDRYNLRGALLAGAPGTGKAQPLTAKIKTPGGWSTMGEMYAGKEIIAKDGSVCKVIDVFPQGQKEIFKITFADGRSTECCKEHLWSITRRTANDEHFKEIITTEKLIEYNSRSLYKRLYVDLIDSEDNVSTDFDLHPYILGVYLGDGGSSGTANTVTITTPDEFIINEINKYLPLDCKLSISMHKFKCASYRVVKSINSTPNVRDSIKQSLKDLKLCGLLSHEKFIPKEYLNGSHQQRLELLQGLMDTDGTCDIQSTCSYSTTSEQLALDVQYLVRSLGGIAKISLKLPTYSYLGEKKLGRISYQVNIRYKKPSDLFRLPKKKIRTKDDGQYSEYLRLRIDKIESIGFKEAQCISIDHPEHLYVTDDFIVTHNTFMGLATAQCLDAKKVIIICPKNATLRVWEASILEVFKKPQTYWISQLNKPYNNERFIVAHFEALEKVHELLPKIGNEKLVIILDESHNLNEMTSNRTKSFIELCSKTRCSDIILASGTPIKALGSESIPLFKAIDPYFDEDTEMRFRKIYGKDASRGLDILKHRLGIVSFKVEKKELNLVPPIMQNINVSMPNSQQYTLNEIARDMKIYTAERMSYFAGTKKEDEKYFYGILENYERKCSNKKEFNQYKDYLSQIIKTYKTGDLRSVKDEMIFCNQFENKCIIPTLSSEDKVKFKSVKTIVKYVALKVQGECLGRVLGRKRIQCHIDMIPFIDFKSICNSTLKKTVIFTSFVEALEECDKYLKTKELFPLVVYGKTNSELAETVKRFENDENLNPLIATYNSLSTAVPLIMADTMIMLNAPFRAYIQEQAIARIHRLGADTQTYVYMVNLDTGKEVNISTRSIDILAWSQDQVTKIMGIESPYQIEENVSIESMTDKPLVRISCEEYDLDESVTLENIGLESTHPGFLRW